MTRFEIDDPGDVEVTPTTPEPPAAALLNTITHHPACDAWRDNSPNTRTPERLSDYRAHRRARILALLRTNIGGLGL